MSNESGLAKGGDGFQFLGGRQMAAGVSVHASKITGVSWTSAVHAFPAHRG